MRKKEYKKIIFCIRRAPVTLLLWITAPPILLSLLTLLHSIESTTPLTAARANYLGSLLEYHAAAVMLLTCGSLLLHLAKKEK